MRLPGFVLCIGFLCGGIVMWGQKSELPQFALSQSMPIDRLEESYAIYSQLLVNGPIEWRDIKRDQWLIEDTTTANPIDQPCDAGNSQFSTTPHGAVAAPKGRQAEWNDVLADYDRHCHDRILLEAERFRVDIPIRLLNEADQKRYEREQSTRSAKASEFVNAEGLHSFSEVYFNAHHTLALVHQGIWCGMLCGNWTWVVMEKKDNQWKQLPWVRTFTVS